MSDRTPPPSRITGPARITVVPAAATAGGLVLVATGLGFGRVDVALTGALLLVAVGAALVASPRSPAVELRIEEPEDADIARDELRVRAVVTAPGAETVRVSSRALGFASLPIAVAAPATLTYRLPLRHTGPQELLAISAEAVGADASRIADRGPERTVTRRIPPRALALPFLPLPLVLGGRTGSHDSRRPGDGGEFHDIHPFAPGDRLRRIDWRATARLARTPADLYVRRTLATADADVALVLDDRDDIAGAPSTWSAGDRSLLDPTSLDLAREAAWSIASAYLDASDHVAFQLVSNTGRDLVRGSGARHRSRLRSAITAVTGGSPLARVGVPPVPRGALVVLLSTFLDAHAVALAVRWRRSGHRVLAIDTLPRPRRAPLRREERIAERIVLAEREDRMRTLRTVGVDVLRWDVPAGERAAVLRTLTRPRRRG